MAWWTHILFLNRRLRSWVSDHSKEETPFYSLDMLYFSLSAFTYLYLAAAVLTFFFEKHVPAVFPDLIDVLSEPYLGALGIYVVVKEVERRRGNLAGKRWGELFAAFWFIFLITATLFTYFSAEYRPSGVYKTVVTNALAALIIRLGTLVR